MSEIIEVQAFNWSEFFLQKLDFFFNEEMDNCDLTLQFNDTSQLKVHKLVLNACTDYFNILEQTCEMIDDVLIMPNELQANLIVPIVNFMYTGTLKFEVKIYSKLLKLASDMNFPILFQLLKTHRRTMETDKQNVRCNNSKVSPRKAVSVRCIERIIHTQATNFRRLSTPVKNTNQGGEIRQIKNSQQTRCITRSSSAITSTSIKAIATKLEQNTNIKKEDENHDPLILLKPETGGASSPFKRLRKTTFNNNNSSPASILQQPLAKKPNIENFEEYCTKLFDDIDEEAGVLQQKKYKNIKQEQKPTIVLKDSASSNVDQNKDISEILRKYPHLIKKIKRIN